MAFTALRVWHEYKKTHKNILFKRDTESFDVDFSYELIFLCITYKSWEEEKIFIYHF